MHGAISNGAVMMLGFFFPTKLKIAAMRNTKVVGVENNEIRVIRTPKWHISRSRHTKNDSLEWRSNQLYTILIYRQVFGHFILPVLTRESETCDKNEVDPWVITSIEK